MWCCKNFPQEIWNTFYSSEMEHWWETKGMTQFIVNNWVYWYWVWVRAYLQKHEQCKGSCVIKKPMSAWVISLKAECTGNSVWLIAAHYVPKAPPFPQLLLVIWAWTGVCKSFNGFSFVSFCYFLNLMNLSPLSGDDVLIQSKLLHSVWKDSTCRNNFTFYWSKHL